MRVLEAEKFGLNWLKLAGPRDDLVWNQVDMETLEVVISTCLEWRVAVQAGANLGTFPKRLARDFETVYAFEPDPRSFLLAHENAPEENIIWMQAALGANHDPVQVVRGHRDGKPRSHSGVWHVKPGGRVPTLKIDDLALRVCDLIYLDVEGYELNALRGALDTLKRRRPVVAVEVNKNLELAGASRRDVFELLRSVGYRWSFTMRSDEVFLPQERVGAVTR